MTIHHDKLAYGKLASSREDMSEQKLLEMAKKLNEQKTAPKEAVKREDNIVIPPEEER